MKKAKIMTIGLLLLSMILLLAGCQSSTVADSSKNGGKSVKKIIIGTGSEYKPYCFLDEKNNLTGFEIEVLKKVNERLPQYEFEFKNFDFNAILISLETGKIDLAAHQFEVNADRKSKYLFGDEGVTLYDLKLVVKDSDNKINSLDDLAAIGGTVEVGKASSNKTAVVDRWNKEHDNKLKLILEASDTTITLQNIDSGKTDAFVNIQRNVDAYKATYGAKIKTVGEPISRSNSYYLYRKNDDTGAQLKKDVDAVLKTLKEDGTLTELSKKWLGGDYIPKK
ncbi:transporter substrate-binding domain-containing protein [Pelosinus sp. sgz500959]|uniref:transporter substrate-binding domain-containing protein n=1 Tax=Pelosinus sp. sgz500959 TaxID=3242472 RepID=UPI0036725E61